MADPILQRCRTANCTERQEGPFCAAHDRWGRAAAVPAEPAAQPEPEPKVAAKAKRPTAGLEDEPTVDHEPATRED